MLLVAAVLLGEATSLVHTGEALDAATWVGHSGAAATVAGGAVTVLGASEVHTGGDFPPEYAGWYASETEVAVLGSTTLVFSADGSWFWEGAPAERKQRAQQAGLTVLALAVVTALWIRALALGFVRNRIGTSAKATWDQLHALTLDAVPVLDALPDVSAAAAGRTAAT